MGKIMIPLLLAFAILLQSNSCKKSKPQPDNGCGCNTATIVQSVTDITAQLGYISDSYTTGWFLKFPAGNGFNNLCKICNTDLQKLKIITDTLNHSNYVNVKFSGKAKDLCDGESFGFNNGSVFYYYLTLDDITKK